MVRRGCVLFAGITLVIVLVGGYFAYRWLDGRLSLEPELERYENDTVAASLLKGGRPAPPDSATLTKRQVELYVDSFDPLSSGWEPILEAARGMGMTADGADSSVDVWRTPELIRSLRAFAPRTRKAMVDYLNEHDLSWNEYLWIKEHVVAASSIEQHDVDSLVNIRVPDGVSFPGINRDGGHFWRRVGELRSSGAIDSSDRALVAPYNDRIRTEGLPSLLGVDNVMTTTKSGAEVKIK